MITILKYNAGNVQSVLFALQRLGVNAIVTDQHDEIRASEKVIFPGVGHASSAMDYLKSKNLDKLIQSLRQPVLGICLGMQLLGKKSEEGNSSAIGIFDVEVKRFGIERSEDSIELAKIPHMGWNTIHHLSSPLFKGVAENSYVYFVHGYYATIGKDTIAQTEYIQPFSAALQKNNFYGVQFHAEKSAEIGDRILSNFLQL